MLHYPRIVIPEERYAWIYPLSMRLEPRAFIYLWNQRQQDTKDTWDARLHAKELQTAGDGEALKKLCAQIMVDYPLMHCFFTFFVDSLLMTGRLQEAGATVEQRKQWMVNNSYKVISTEAIELGARDLLAKTPNGYVYKQSMYDWISNLRTLQFYEIDVQKKVDDGFVFRQRTRRNNRR